MKTLDFLEFLSNGHSVSGSEYDLQDIIIPAFEKYCDEVSQDSMGNIIGLKKGKLMENNIKIMIAAHMDEIGLMVKDIEENGFLRFTSIGGIDPRTIVGQEVIVHGKKDLFGVIGSKPPHLQNSKEQKKAIKIEDMTIDIGLDKEEVKEFVSIGDTININRKLIPLKNNRISGKSLDNKTGVTVLLETLKKLENIKHEADIYFVATVQEEVTMAGALTSTYSINPDIGIAVDVGFGNTPELDKSKTINLSEGPGISLGGNIHPRLRKELIDISNKYNIPTQIEISPGATGTDARAMQITREGIPCLVISVPLRYMHTSVEVIDIDDIYDTSNLLAFFISSISNNNLEGLLCY